MNVSVKFNRNVHKNREIFLNDNFLFFNINKCKLNYISIIQTLLITDIILAIITERRSYTLLNCEKNYLNMIIINIY